MTTKQNSYWKVATLVLLLAAFQTQASVQTTMPDIYSELAPAGTREEVSASLNEFIDPFSGGLTISHEDLVVPGNGGLDIKIQRTYSSNNVYKSRITDNSGPELHNLVNRSPTGLGWTMHFGKVTRDNAYGCSPTSTEGIDNLNNPIFEAPDGSQQIFHYNNSSQNGINATWVSKNHWVAYCSSDNFRVISPEGIKYYMGLRLEEGQPYGSSDNMVWYTTKVTDPNGNYYDIEYDSGPTDENLIIDYIDASDGRRINFGYVGISSGVPRLSQISLVQGPTWNYHYTSLGTGQGHYLLDYVTRPDGSRWEYDYHSFSGGTAGDNVLEEITYPYGGTTRYAYDYKCLGYVSCINHSDRAYSLVVDTKTTGGRDVDAGTWNYDYAPNNNETNLTTVYFPGGRYVYEHYGLRWAIQHPTSQLLWRVGLLKSKRTYNGSSLIQTESYAYDNMIVSYEDYMRPPYTDGFYPFEDNETRAPRLTQKTINRDGRNYVTSYQNFTDNINPHRIVTSGQVSRTTTLTYFPRSNGQNIVSRVEDEDFGGTNREINRSFDTEGNMTMEEIYGVRNTYLYDGEGNVSRRTNERGHRWDYSRYERGIARTEDHPTNIDISREVDAHGMIEYEEDGRGNRTDYDYDGLGRITSVDFPRSNSAAASISWSSTSRSVSRGNYSENTVFDGFGRPSCLRRENVYINYDYDEHGRLIFESYPGSSCTSSIGTSYQYDALDRLTRMTHNGGSYVSYTYLTDNKVRVRDERAHNTTYSYRSYGDPDQKELIRIESPESITTVIGRNEIGQVTSVSQGGETRTYNYTNSSNPFLYSEIHPETGTTTYGRDAVGNMTSKRVGSSATTTYTYDGLNQLTYINHPSGTPDIDMNYDRAGNLDNITVVGGNSEKNFYYDDNDNLYREQQVIAGRTYNIYYTYDNLDHLATLRYPGGQLITFNPDDLGRPNTAFPYVHNVDYFRNGMVQRLDYANGRYIINTQDSRQRLRDIDLSGGAVNLRYIYDAANNTTQITDYQDSSRTRNLGYDDVNRLDSASGIWGSGSINYRSGSATNIDSKTIGSQSISYNYSSNRLSSVSGLPGGTRSYTYDEYGNIASKTGGLEYIFDDASNLRTIELANSVIRSYDYDGLKNKVRTTQNGASTIHIYSKSGQLLADHNASGVALKEYAYVGDKLVANVIKSGAPPPNTNQNTPIPINLNQVDTNSYGWGYGNSNHKDHLIVSFDKPNTDVRFCAVGLHISNSTEVRVELNGAFLGYMDVGMSKETCFDIAESQFITGTNQIKFVQAVSGNIWGVTNIRIGNVVMPPILFLLLGDE